MMFPFPHSDVYVNEVEYQIEAFLGAVREMDPYEGLEFADANARRAHTALAFRNMQSIITAAAQLSKLFWAPAPPKNKDLSVREKTVQEFAETRSGYLRRLFAVESNSPLKDREVRNAYEHLDNRLDRLFTKGHVNPVIERCTGSRSDFAPAAQKPLFKRFFDPDSGTLTVMNSNVALPPQIAEVERLEGALQKHRREEEQRWSALTSGQTSL